VKPLRILITAGPTIEPIDPVRFISNRSTGRMGYEMARIAVQKKHKVTLISGPSRESKPAGAKIVHIETARQLQKEIRRRLKKFNALIMASAVSDFRPELFSAKKIKLKKRLTLTFFKNTDILESIRKKERKGRILVGFALETENLIKNAYKKLKNKKLDLIAANGIGPRNTPFGRGKKDIYLLDKRGVRKKLKNTTKTAIARAILDTVEELCYTSN